MKLLNLTPHNVTFLLTGAALGAEHTVPTSGTVARVTMKTEHQGTVRVPGGYINVAIPEYGEVLGLPPQTEDTALIVSTMVADALRGSGRTDIYVPDSGPDAVRDDKGQVKAVRRLLYRGATSP